MSGGKITADPGKASGATTKNGPYSNTPVRIFVQISVHLWAMSFFLLNKYFGGGPDLLHISVT